MAVASSSPEIPVSLPLLSPLSFFLLPLALYSPVCSCASDINGNMLVNGVRVCSGSF